LLLKGLNIVIAASGGTLDCKAQ